MALVQEMGSPPLFADGTPYSAGLVRRLLGSLAGVQIGRFEDGDFAVTLSGSTVTVAPGRASIPSAATEVGTYLVEALSATVLTLDPADNTRERFDALVAYVEPPATPQQVGKWFLAIRKGTPAESPQLPNTDNTYLIGTFRIPSAATGLPPSVLSDKVRDSHSQVIVVGPTQAGYLWPDGAKVGTIWTDWDERRTYVYDGVDWVLINQGIRDYSNPGEPFRPQTNEIIYDRSTRMLLRYNGSSFEELDVQFPRGKMWRTAAFQPLPANGVEVGFNGSRVQGGVLADGNGLVVPRDGMYRVDMYCYATGNPNFKAGFGLQRVRFQATNRTILYIAYHKENSEDYTATGTDVVPLRLGDKITVNAHSSGGIGHTWGISEVEGVRFSVEYVRSLPSGTVPV